MVTKERTETLWIGDGCIGDGKDRDASILFGEIESNRRIGFWRQFKLNHFIFDVVRIEFLKLSVKVLLHL